MSQAAAVIRLSELGAAQTVLAALIEYPQFFAYSKRLRKFRQLRAPLGR